MVELVKLVEQGIDLVAAAERPDLRQRLEQTRQRLLDPNTRVIVVGEFKQGKSQLINALVNAPVCPVDTDIATSVPTVVRHGTVPSARIFVAAGGEAASSGEQPVESRPVKLEELAGYVSERGNPGNRNNLVAAEVRLPREILAGGLSFVDSPGLGGLDSVHSLTTITALPTADAMLLVSDASQEYTEPEIKFLRQALRITPNVACVLSKTDLYPHWLKVAGLDRSHLHDVDPRMRLFPVSADLRLHAARLQDTELNDESGFPPLVAYLRAEVLGQSERLQQRSVALDLLSITEHLRLSLQSELNALLNPDTTPQMIAELEAAKARADELRRRSARWQTTLNDGVGDLISDMEYDLRDRMRSIQRDAEQAIDAADPGKNWPETAAWLERRVAAAVSDTFVWTNERAGWLSEQVAEHFSQDRVPLPELRVDNTTDVLDPVRSVETLDPGRLNPVQKMFIGMRGSYGGVLMFGLLTGIVGMSLINPISVGAGLLIGGKVYKDEKAARLKRRQGEAKAIVRSHVDDVIFQVGKQLKDRLRLVQRGTRDHFTDIAEEHHRSLAESVLAAQKAATTYSVERDQRARDIKLTLRQVDELHQAAGALVPPAQQPQP
ncbi:isoniazid-induced dynamin-like GTPase IniA [Parafrigoribacterium mesophilum]|uniref:dynamin family protein n=1 Tax=Parafrigoribacterium mesophilum TaxID=433646 RepID=UPI0031FD582F